MNRQRLIALLAVAFVAAGAAYAGQFGKFLRPDQAFRFSAKTAPGTAELSWRIADGYYLYKRRFKVKAETGAIGKIAFPAGDVENDPNFGRVTVYHHHVTLKVPVSKRSASGVVRLAVTYQGCAEAGLCYPPMTRHVTLQVPSAVAAGGLSGSSQAPGGASGQAAPVSQQDRLAALVEHANPLWFVLVFFGLGLLLAFTPCVLPMIPVLAGVIGGESGRLSARRGFVLSLVYVVAMALVYTAAGVAAGFAGTSLQALFQTPWVIGVFAALFVGLAGTLFGFYELRMPSALVDRLSQWSGRQRGGTWVGAAFMGVLSALLVSPCVAAPLAGALIVIGQAGEPVRGGIALFALSLGMGAPLVVFGTVAGRLLPKAGAWMVLVERLLGVAMLAYAVWLLGRVVPAPLTLVLWGITGILAAVFLGLFERLDKLTGAGARLSKAVAVAVLIWSLALIVGGAAGAKDPLQPLRGLAVGPASRSAPAQALQVHTVDTPARLDAALERAAAARRPVMVDFYADWCAACLEMEHSTLRNARVRSALARMRIVKVDVTRDTPGARKLLKRYSVYGPPAYVFYDAKGRHLSADTVIGYLSAPAFLGHLRQVLTAG